jgi:hypothetical protein
MRHTLWCLSLKLELNNHNIIHYVHKLVFYFIIIPILFGILDYLNRFLWNILPTFVQN